MKKHLLFVCSSNLDRSPCAEELFKGSNEYEAKSCGINPQSKVKVSKEIIEWADIIFCMGYEHKEFIYDNFPRMFNEKEVIVLEIPDTYVKNNPKLKELLKDRLKECFLND